jgi:hypothetical protein
MAAEHTNPFQKLTEIEIGRFEIETLILAGNGFETGAAERGLIPMKPGWRSGQNLGKMVKIPC